MVNELNVVIYVLHTVRGIEKLFLMMITQCSKKHLGYITLEVDHQFYGYLFIISYTTKLDLRNMHVNNEVGMCDFMVTSLLLEQIKHIVACTKICTCMSELKCMELRVLLHPWLKNTFFHWRT